MKWILFTLVMLSGCFSDEEKYPAITKDFCSEVHNEIVPILST